VREDAERGRIYLPLADMQAAGTNPENLLLATCDGRPSQEIVTLLEAEIARAQQYYRAADELTPLLAPDSQPAMRVLASIYHCLLDRIAVSPAAVFRERVSVPTPQKLAILAPGLLRSFTARIFG
jgi:phytoene synthase